MITSLEKNQFFVFGSNIAGRHMGGAALQAKEQFGAEEGIGEGLTGQCYAFPTLYKSFNYGGLQQRMKQELEQSVKKFYATARALPEKEFLMTPVGIGIAGYEPEYMKSLFTNPPANVVLPDWTQNNETHHHPFVQ
jgi:hypothetical protein